MHHIQLQVHVDLWPQPVSVEEVQILPNTIFDYKVIIFPIVTLGFFFAICVNDDLSFGSRIIYLPFSKMTFRHCQKYRLQPPQKKTFKYHPNCLPCCNASYQSPRSFHTLDRWPFFLIKMDERQHAITLLFSPQLFIPPLCLVHSLTFIMRLLCPTMILFLSLPVWFCVCVCVFVLFLSQR